VPRRFLVGDMAHCYSVGVNIDGTEHEVCTTHVPGNEHVRKAVESGQQYNLTDADVKRAVDYYMRKEHKIKEPHIESPEVETMMEPKDAERK
jgi:hypothetical protein